MSSTIRFDLDVTATSSIKHGGQLLGTTMMLRRETIVDADGLTRVEIPIISGNALRAMLRRTAEMLLRDVLQYEGAVSYPAAVALLGGGRLAKTAGEPLSGQRLLTLRNLNPLLSIFGASTAGTCIEGALDVGKLIPHLRETVHLVDTVATPPAAAIEATQQETYSRVDHDTTPELSTMTDGSAATHEPSSPMVFQFETFPAGQRFSSWLQLRHATDLEVAFFRDVIATYAATGTIGGRTAIGHGRITADVSETLIRGTPQPFDWRAHLIEHRAEALDALQDLK